MKRGWFKDCLEAIEQWSRRLPIRSWWQGPGGCATDSASAEMVVYDGGWYQVEGPGPDGWCELHIIRIPWLKASSGAEIVRRVPQAAVLAGSSSPSRPEATRWPPRKVDVRPSQVIAGDGPTLCAADTLQRACQGGHRHVVPSHGRVLDLSEAACPGCFSDQ